MSYMDDVGLELAAERDALKHLYVRERDLRAAREGNDE